MSDTVKLVIEMPKNYYEIIKHEVDHHISDYRPFVIIANGAPLDSIIEDIKAEMKELKGTFPTSKYIAIINKHMKGNNK